jgi:hypothetical protein
MDPVIVVMIEKLSDGNIRIREGARKGLEVLAGDVIEEFSLNDLYASFFLQLIISFLWFVS